MEGVTRHREGHDMLNLPGLRRGSNYSAYHAQEDFLAAAVCVGRLAITCAHYGGADIFCARRCRALATLWIITVRAAVSAARAALDTILLFS